MLKKMKNVLTELKPEIVHCSGLEETLRKLERFFSPDDYQRTKCELKNKGTIAAWDMLIDTLKCCGDDAFAEFRSILHDNKCFSDIQLKFEDICKKNGIGGYTEESSSSDDDRSSVWTNQDLPLQEVNGKDKGLKIDSTASWSSIESETSETFGSRRSSADDRRERFGSSGSKNGSTGSRGSFNMPKAISIDDEVQQLPITARRRLSDLLNKKNSINKDWRAVAGMLGMDNTVFQNIANDEDPMESILEYMHHETRTIGDLVDIFKKMNSKECIKILVEDGGVQGIPEELFKRQFSNFDRLTSVEETTSESCQETCEKDHGKKENQPVQETENVEKRGAAQNSGNVKESQEASRNRNDVFEYEECPAANSSYGNSIQQVSERQGTTYSGETEAPGNRKSSNPGEKWQGSLSKPNLEVKAQTTEEVQQTNYSNIQQESEFHGASWSDETKGPDKRWHCTSGEKRQDSLPQQNLEKLKQINEYKKETEVQPFQSSMPIKKLRQVRCDENGMSRIGMVLPIDKRTLNLTPLGRNKEKQLDEINSDSAQCEYGCCDDTSDDNVSSSSRSPIDSTDRDGKVTQSSPRTPNIADLPPRIFSMAVDRLLPCKATEEAKQDDVDREKSSVEDKHGRSSAFVVEQQSSEPDEQDIKGSGMVGIRQAFDSLEVKGRLINSEKDSLTKANVTLNAIIAKGSGIKGMKTHADCSQADQCAATEMSFEETTVYARSNEFNVKSGKPEKSTTRENTNGNFGKTSEVSWYELGIWKLLDVFGWGRTPVFPDRAARTPEIIKHGKVTEYLRFNSSSGSCPTENAEPPEETKPDNIERKSNVGIIPHDAENSLMLKKAAVSSGKPMKKRLALIICNTSYKLLPTLPTSNGCRHLESQLKSCGWEVDYHVDVTRQDLTAVVNNFEAKARDQIAVVFYFGHSVQMKRVNYLLPVCIDEEAIKTVCKLNRHAYSFDLLRQKTSGATASILFVDAGRQLKGCKSGFFDVQPINNQCVLFCTSEDSSKRFVADKLADAVGSTEDCSTLLELIRPFKEDFVSPSSVSKCYLPVSIKSIKASPDDCDVQGLRIPAPHCPKHAFIFKAGEKKEPTDALESIHTKWKITHCQRADDLESDFENFSESISEDSPKICLFYYEGPVAMENGQLSLAPDNNSSVQDKMDVSWILDSLAETVSGPRIVIINGFGTDERIDKSVFKDLKLQEVFFSVSTKLRSSQGNDQFFSELTAVLGQDGYLKKPLLLLGKEFNFETLCNSLFYA